MQRPNNKWKAGKIVSQFWNQLKDRVQARGAQANSTIGIIGGADGPTAIFVSSYSAQTLWGLCVKVFSNVIVVVLNYVFSKLIIFKKKK